MPRASHKYLFGIVPTICLWEGLRITAYAAALSLFFALFPYFVGNQFDKHACILIAIMSVLNIIFFTFASIASHYRALHPRHWVTEGNGYAVDVVKLNPKLMRKIVRWCRENCQGKWNYSHNTFYFSDQEDAAMFRLTFL